MFDLPFPLGDIDCPEPGIYPDMPDDEYFRLNAVSNSVLKEMRHSPGIFRDAVENPERKDTDAMLLGSLVHCLVLEPWEMDNRYVLTPEVYTTISKKADVDRGLFEEKGVEIQKKWSGNATECKRWKASQAGSTIIKPDMLAQGRAMSEALIEVIGAEVIKNGLKECVIVWDDPETNIRCKAKLDLVAGGQIIDLKSIGERLGYDTFAWQAKKMGYFEQAAMYRDGWNQILLMENKMLPETPAFIFAIVESIKPYRSKLCDMFDVAHKDSYPMMDMGRTEYKFRLRCLAYATKTGKWPMFIEHATESLEEPFMAGPTHHELLPPAAMIQHLGGI